MSGVITVDNPVNKCGLAVQVLVLILNNGHVCSTRSTLRAL
jgi:hypothetical protein